MFDNPQKIIGDFYVLTDFARHHSYKKDNVMYEDTLYGTKYNYYGHYNYFNFLEEQISIPFIMTEETRCTKQPLLSNHSKYILDSHDHWHTTNEDTWQDCYDTTSLGMILYQIHIVMLSTKHMEYIYFH